MAYTLIWNGTLVDGLGGQPVPDAAVLINDNQIRDVGRKAEINLPNEEIWMVDAQNAFLSRHAR
jgi:hypothetical protein